jgi:hypothetical protein
MSASDVCSFPRVNDHLVRPETREELVRGRLMLKPFATAPHAARHSMINSVTRNVISPEHRGASGLLTRFGSDSDFGTDVCIRREGIDPATGTRYLEELVFEIVHEEPLEALTERAEILSARGVRRVLAIFVVPEEVREWKDGQWVLLDPEGTISDPALAQPLPVRALLDRAEANRAVVQGLKAKQDPAILEIEQAGVEKGLEQGRAQMARTAIEVLCEVLDHPLDAERRALLQTLDSAKLEALLDAIRTERRWP